jgi:elongation factor P
MDTDTYEQFSLPENAVRGRELVREGQVIDILFHAETEEPITTELPGRVDLKVIKTDPGLKGDTATGGSKPATVESGAVVNVPLFIDEGDIISVNTETGEYVTRVSLSDKI